MNLQNEREKAKLTQLQLAAKLGVNAQQISNWERGAALIPIKHAHKLASILKIRVDIVVGFIVKQNTEKLIKKAKEK